MTPEEEAAHKRYMDFYNYPTQINGEPHTYHQLCVLWEDVFRHPENYDLSNRSLAEGLVMRCIRQYSDAKSWTCPMPVGGGDGSGMIANLISDTVRSKNKEIADLKARIDALTYVLESNGFSARGL